MTPGIPDIPDILKRLIACPTVSRRSNLELLDAVEAMMRPAGVRCERFVSDDGQQANLWTSIGPERPDGVVLSGHCDVVPVEGQAWTTNPFILTLTEGRYFGRGTADMKGFLAVAIHAMLHAASRPLRLPMLLAISYNEEIGCLGVRGLLKGLRARSHRPALCIVGEPRGMRIATGHKGKRALRADCHGHSSNSALAPQALNALHLGAALIDRLRARQDNLEARGARDPGYDIPYSTLHVGMMSGGTALNVVPNLRELDFEIRNVAAHDPDTIVEQIVADAEAIAAPWRNCFPEARIEIEDVLGYPGLDTPTDVPAVALLGVLLGQDDPPIKVSFGTEGGLFHRYLGLPVLICGPGHIAQGHKPDEFISAAQLEECAAFLAALVDALEEGTAPALGGRP